MPFAANVTNQLRARCGLAYVVAPRPTLSGAYFCLYGEYPVALFDYLGDTTAFEEPMTPAELLRAAAMVAAVHGETGSLSLTNPALERFDSPHKQQILRLLDSARVAINPFQVRLYHLLTHGDPNRANFLRDHQGQPPHDRLGQRGPWPTGGRPGFFSDSAFERFLWTYRTKREPLTLHEPAFAFYLSRMNSPGQSWSPICLSGTVRSEPASTASCTPCTRPPGADPPAVVIGAGR